MRLCIPHDVVLYYDNIIILNCDRKFAKRDLLSNLSLAAYGIA